MIVQEKKLSNKVNYDILKEFSGGDERIEREMEDKKMVIKMEMVKLERESNLVSIFLHISTNYFVTLLIILELVMCNGATYDFPV